MKNGSSGLKFDGSIADAWQSFIVAVVPKNAPKVQKQQMELAFYSGAHSVLSMLRNMPEDIDDGDGMAVIKGWQTECKDFKDDYLSNLDMSQK